MVHFRTIMEENMNKLFATTIALLGMLIVQASAGDRLVLSAHQEIGCKMLNSVMAAAWEGDDFLECNDQRTDHLHRKAQTHASGTFPWNGMC